MRTRTDKRRWDDMNDDDNRDRPGMADDDVIDSRALTGGDITRDRALRCTNQLLVTRPSRPQDRIDAGMLCDGKTIDAELGMRQENWQVPRRQAESEVLVPLATEW